MAITCSRFLGTFLYVALVVSPTARGNHDDRIQKAIDRGVERLKALQKEDGNWPFGRLGATALAGLALLECGVPASDPSIQKAAGAVRPMCLELDDIYTTYSLSLAVLFLERLGDPADEILIQSMAARLLAGQNAAGGWTYSCPKLGEEETHRLTTLVQERRSVAAKPAQPPASRGKPSPSPLPNEIRGVLARLERQGPREQAGLDNLLGGSGDNSNTQFAILALWAARRHGIPVEQALALTEARFRRSQRMDGGWGYMPALGAMPGVGDSTPSMTCAGLLGLALGYGVAVLRTEPQQAIAKPNTNRATRDITADLPVRAGLLALGTTIGTPLPGNPSPPSPLPAGARGEDLPAVDYYFLWSVERVAVAYDLATINNRDWYAWGSEILVSAQQPEGGWKGKYGSDIDTSFALLFLTRANVTRELTAYFKGRFADPGKATLRAAPRIDVESEAAKLAAELVRARGKKRAELVERLRDGKGVVYSLALANALQRVNGTEKSELRDALAQRLTRMTAETLRDKLKDGDREIRRAAALACGMKADRQTIPDLIPILEDQDGGVARAAHAALKDLTGQDFGPTTYSSESKTKAVAKWNAWWKKENGS
jgi:hypothetical protein